VASALLVCGSRSLARDTDRPAWVADTLRAVLSPRPDLLVHGGARGPDEMADAEAAGKLAATRAKAKDPAPFIAVEFLRVGLVAVDEFDATPGVNGYPVEVLYAPGGTAAWAAFRDEVSTRIRTWSTLGESVLSPSEP